MRLVTTVVASLATVAAGLSLAGLSLAGPASAASVATPAIVTPGNFTGYGFDQCTAPTQHAMNRWLRFSPYFAAGIYISGDSRGCTSQPNLSPTWVSTQLAKGWRLLPITLGPQASCTTRERYLHQVRIDPSTTSSYAKARRQGRAEARKTVRAATSLGISPGSTLWYDIEAFSITRTACRESALSFLSAWTRTLHKRDYVSGVYSSAASGITMLDDARVTASSPYRLPDRIWIADWDGVANTSSSYVRSTGWVNHQRVHQYRGGHAETYGGVTIDIDQNWLDLGRGSVARPERAHCGGAAVYDYLHYRTRSIGDSGPRVRTIQCLLAGRQAYTGSIDGGYDAGLGAAVRAFRVAHGLSSGTTTTRATWVALLADGSRPLSKIGSASKAVRRIQRSLNAADSAGLTVSGVFDGATSSAVTTYQGEHAMRQTGVVGPRFWALLASGTR